MKTKSSLFSTIFLAALLVSVEAQAGTLDDIGFTDLKLELGSGLPDGSSVTVTQAEPRDDDTTPSWVPDISSGQFALKTFNDKTPGSNGVSSHATSVAMRFYGKTVSTVSAVGMIDLYEAGDWLGSGFLYLGAIGPIANSIDISTTRLINHSWEWSDPVWNSEVLRRIDFLVEVDDFIQVVGVGTNTTVNMVPSNCFNAIVAGITNETIVTGTAAVDATYTSGRAKPDVVIPETTGSAAAAWTSSVATLLIDHAHENPSLSMGSTTNRNSDTIQNAERSETIKAILMAGADRATTGTTNPGNADITDYRVDVINQAENGLDKRFGAGQVNVFNSYHILAGGEQNSAEDGGTTIVNTGFDYDPAFGGLNSSLTATYSFSTGAIGGQKIKAALVWNLDVLTISTDNLYDLDLQLIDVTDGNAIVASSTSTIDNTENIWFDLASNNDYQLKVIRGSGQADFNWDYALAWQMVVPGVTVVETDSTTMTAEDGTTDTFTVVLDSPPAGDVTIDLVSSDTGEGTVSPSSLTFTSANWSTLQVVTVTGVNDAVDDGDKNYSIGFTLSSAEANYNGMTLPGVSVSNTDDDATFSFTDQTDVALNAVITSNTVTITGLLNPAVISITDGEYLISSGIYTSIEGLVNDGDTVTVRTISSVSGLTAVDVVLNIGAVSDTFTVTTETDTDGDGVGDSTDAFPNDPAETVDTDGDGVGDNADAFPNDPAETADTDSDGIGDNADAFPSNIAASVDADNDGLPDEWNAACDVTCKDSSGLILDVLLDDTDNDGVVNASDAFPNDPTETVDSDGDGVGDNADAFPNDANESSDRDGDGVGDNADAFPNDATETLDTDGDGIGDNTDAFPNDPAETVDTDGDGVGDNADAFPNDTTETTDSDGDGVGDNADAFPSDATETLDTDDDGIGDNADAFPDNIAASVDADNDEKPDEWNAACDAICQENSGLILDVATDAATGTSSGGGGSLSLMWLLLPLFITAGRRRVS